MLQFTNLNSLLVTAANDLGKQNGALLLTYSSERVMSPALDASNNLVSFRYIEMTGLVRSLKSGRRMLVSRCIAKPRYIRSIVLIYALFYRPTSYKLCLAITYLRSQSAKA